MLIRESLERYIDRLSSDSPTPGGGSASAVVAALGISLVIMVAKIRLKKLTASDQKATTKTIKFLNQILKDTKQIIDLDVRVYEVLMQAYRDSKKMGASPKSTKTIQTALVNSFRLQADLALLVIMAKEAMGQVSRVAQGSIANDLVVAKGFLDGAFRGAMATARINLHYIHPEKKDHFERALVNLQKRFK